MVVDSQPRRLQFGIESLLVLTTLVAAALAVLRPLGLPPGLYAAAAAYAICFALYIAFRGVSLWRRWRWQARQLDQRRHDLYRWAEHQRTSSSDEPGSTTDRPPRL